jgi:hypothetical protein
MIDIERASSPDTAKVQTRKKWEEQLDVSDKDRDTQPAYSLAAESYFELLGDVISRRPGTSLVAGFIVGGLVGWLTSKLR